MAKFELQPIVPKKPISTANIQKVRAALRDYAVDVVDRMSADYDRVPPSPRYRRTGNLGRSWDLDGPKARGADLVVEMGNNVKYAGYVQGFLTVGNKRQRQTRLQQRRGWSSLETVAKKQFDDHRKDIEQALRG